MMLSTPHTGESPRGVVSFESSFSSTWETIYPDVNNPLNIDGEGMCLRVLCFPF